MVGCGDTASGGHETPLEADQPSAAEAEPTEGPAAPSEPVQWRLPLAWPLSAAADYLALEADRSLHGLAWLPVGEPGSGWLLFAEAAGPSSEEQPARLHSLHLRDADQPRLGPSLDLPVIRDSVPGALSLALGQDQLFILSQSYEASSRLERIGLEATDQANWRRGLPDILASSRPYQSLFALEDGGCLVVQGGMEAGGGMVVLRLSADGDLVWARYLERPEALRDRILSQPPLVGLGRRGLQVLWQAGPPASLPDHLPGSLADSLWLYQLQLADGRLAAWQLGLEGSFIGRAWPLAADGSGFALYDSLRGRFFRLAPAGDGTEWLHAFVLPAFITANQGEYDLMRRELRRLRLQPGPGAALVRMLEAEDSGPPAWQGLLLWDAELRPYAAWQWTTPPEAVSLAAGLNLAVLDAGLALVFSGLEADEELEAVSGGGRLVLARQALEPFLDGHGRRPIQEPDLGAKISAYSQPVAAISGISLELLEPSPLSWPLDGGSQPVWRSLNP